MRGGFVCEILGVLQSDFEEYFVQRKEVPRELVLKVRSWTCSLTIYKRKSYEVKLGAFRHALKYPLSTSPRVGNYDEWPLAVGLSEYKNPKTG
jgi:hypothetical protein